MSRPGQTLLCLFVIMGLMLAATGGAQALVMDDDWLLESHGTVMLFTDPLTGRIRYANQAAMSFYGYAEDELARMSLMDLTLRDPILIVADLAAATAGETSYFQTRQLAGGRERMVAIYADPVQYADETLLLLVVIDVTDQVVLAQQQARTRHMLVLGLAVVVLLLLILVCYLLWNRRKLKAEQDRIQYLSLHDDLTGLYNRAYLDDAVQRLDVGRNLPISVIAGDVNALKLTNDVFGHVSGDLLLRKMADTMREACRADDIIARTGGDEFTILLPQTSYQDAGLIVSRIRQLLGRRQIVAIKDSIALGHATKERTGQSLQSVFETAEEQMYVDKSTQRREENRQKINNLVNVLHENQPAERAHAERVSQLSSQLARALHLPDSLVKQVGEAAYLHDIGKIVHSDIITKPYRSLNRQEQTVYRQHPLVGFRILNAIEETADLAEAVLAHHEAWDGTGFPKGSKAGQIPQMARIISIAESFDTNTNGYRKTSISPAEALRRIATQAGSKFDPDMTAAFASMMAFDLDDLVPRV